MSSSFAIVERAYALVGAQNTIASAPKVPWLEGEIGLKCAKAGAQTPIITGDPRCHTPIAFQPPNA